ncbi:MAG: SAM-dependent methyltransferase [Bacteroidales bacterium]|nr:MAG: SAM-dependent methyltransferase [Bacteroidales bacterium]
MLGTLYLIPTTIGTESWEMVIPPAVIAQTRLLEHFVVEDIRTTRRYLSRIGVHTPINQIDFQLLNEHTKQAEIEVLLKPLMDGIDVGLLSEAGLPAIADPGSQLVAIAHRRGIKVVPLTGPSSIFLTLMASGLNGQNFSFVGYLPIKPDERKKRIKQLELRSKQENQTQLFIEAPYRNLHLFQDILKECNPETLLTLGVELTTSSEYICTKKIREWKNSTPPDINKKNCVFCLNYYSN